MSFTRTHGPEVARLYEQGARIADLARTYAMDRETVRYALRQHGVALRQDRGGGRLAVAPANIAELTRAYKSGAPLVGLARRHHHCARTLARWLGEQGVKQRPRNAWSFRFTPAQEQRFAELYLAGATLTEIAREYSTDKALVAKALERNGVPRRSTWESRRLRGTEKLGHGPRMRLRATP